MSRSRDQSERLDPVRWRTPGRSGLLRLTIIAILLTTAAGAVRLLPTATPCTSPSASSSDAGKAPAGSTASAAPPAGSTPGGSAATAAAPQGSATAAGHAPESSGTDAGAAPQSNSTALQGSAGASRGDGRPSIPEGTVGVPVRLADPTALALVHPGDLVDLLRLDAKGDSTPIAGAALVLDVTSADDPTAGGLLLALSPEQAARTVGGQAHGFAVLIRPG